MLNALVFSLMGETFMPKIKQTSEQKVKTIEPLQSNKTIKKIDTTYEEKYDGPVLLT